MTTSEFKKIARLLKEAYKELEEEALKSGVNILSAEYDEMQSKVRLAVLESQGFTLEEYREAKAKVSGFTQADIVDNVEKRDEFISELAERIEEIDSKHIPDEEEIEEIAERIAKKYIKEPVVINKIVERVKEPKIIKETVKVKERVEYNDKPLRKELENLEKKVKEIPIIDVKKLEKDFLKPVQSLKESIEMDWGGRIPDFRKLAMGLQGQIDEIRSNTGGAGVTDGDKGDITVSGSGTVWTIDNDTIGLDELSATGTPSASTFLRGDNTWASISATPGGSNTQVQYNNAGSFGGISGATTNGTNMTFGTGNLLVQDVKASGSGGVAIKNSSGTTVADFGAGSSTNVSLVGAVNMGTGSADYAQYTGGTGVITNTATGSSTDIDITVVPKGTGKFKVTGDVNISGLTASQLIATDASKNLVSLSTTTYPSLTELSYVKGVTSAIQTQIDGKIDGTMVASRIPYGSDSNTLQTSSNLFFDGNQLGVGTSTVTASYRAEILGNATYTKMLRLSTAESYPDFLSMDSAFGQVGYFAGTFKGVNYVIGQTDGNFIISKGAVQLLNFDASTTPIGITFNEGGNNVDTRIEGDTDANLLFVDASTDRVGIGTATPGYKLDVNGTGNFSGDVTVPDEAYGVGWNGSLEVPTKNAIYDKIETLGGGSGITRTVVVTSGSATMGSTASTDYVYFVAGAHTMSLPAASGNTNRYTIKNNHSANITIDTAGAENIEGAASISIAPEESVDIMSDGTNWFVV